MINQGDDSLEDSQRGDKKAEADKLDLALQRATEREYGTGSVRVTVNNLRDTDISDTHIADLVKQRSDLLEQHNSKQGGSDQGS